MWVQLRIARVGPHDLRSLLTTRGRDRAVPDRPSTVWRELEGTFARSVGQTPSLKYDESSELWLAGTALRHLRFPGVWTDELSS